MSPNFPYASGVDTPTAALRRLASRAHRVLRQGRAGDRAELIALLDEIARSRRLLAGAANVELANWFDRLESEAVRMLGRSERSDVRHRLGVEPAPTCGAGMA